LEFVILFSPAKVKIAYIDQTGRLRLPAAWLTPDT